MTELEQQPPQPTDTNRWTTTAARLRTTIEWIRDASTSTAGLIILVGVSIAGWTASFIGLHAFGVQHMHYTTHAAWLVPATFDGAPAGLTLVVMRASQHGRSAWLWRILIVAFTSLSSWINYEHITDHLGRDVAAFMPPSAVILFEAVMSEVRKAAARRAGNRVRPSLHPLRFVFDWHGTWDLIRRYVLDLPLPEALAATSKPTRAASPERRRTATPAAASPLPDRAPAASASPASPTPGNPASPASASPPAASQGTSTTAASKPTTAPGSHAATRHAASPATGNDARDPDETAAIYRALAERLGKAPSDRELGEELGVSRTRAQQLRTAAIDAGHKDLIKPLRAAS